MRRIINHFDIAPGRDDEAEKIFREWASRMAGYSGFLGCHVFKEVGHHGDHEYCVMHDWQSPEDSSAFWQKNKQFAPQIVSSSHHHEEHGEDEDEGAQKDLLHEKFHAHYELILQEM